ncbi:MAG TPA: HDOD domain-containing protein, partial [Acidobacteriota bacterium]|nr:HDOD domain-containing protein [Acidobacteriota bacterium]
SVSSMFRSKEDELEDVLWRHSLATAIGARIIAQRTRVQAEEEVFLAGLVHDLAQLILLQRFADEYRPVLTEMQQSWSQQLDIERDRLGVTHEDIGAIILEQWNFPPQLTALVRNHHDPEAPAEPSGENVDESVRRMRHVVYCADVLADSLGYGFSSDLDIMQALQPSAEYLGLALESLPEISEELTTRVTEEQELFKS